MKVKLNYIRSHIHTNQIMMQNFASLCAFVSVSSISSLSPNYFDSPHISMHRIQPTGCCIMNYRYPSIQVELCKYRRVYAPWYVSILGFLGNNVDISCNYFGVVTLQLFGFVRLQRCDVMVGEYRWNASRKLRIYILR